MKKYWLVAIGLVGGLIGGGILVLFSGQPRGETLALAPLSTSAPIVVHVSGAVAQPDVYQLPVGSRVSDAIEIAGGTTSDAYTQDINLAALLMDGSKVLIPFQPTQTPIGYIAPSQATATIVVTFPINLNTATAEELDALPGIGATRSQDILTYRAEHGPFTTIEQIMNVTGIGEGTFDQIKSLIYVEE